MLIVVDCNRVISSLISKGKTFDVFLLNALLNKLEFIAPEYLFNEIGKNLGAIVSRSKLDKQELADVFELIKSQVKPISFKDFNKFTKEAEQLAPHDKDLQYFALALASKSDPESGIWSDEDGFLEQDKIKILSNNELLDKLFFSLIYE